MVRNAQQRESTAAPAPLRAKDEATTQARLGFRICGVRAARVDGSVWRADRHWGKGLGPGGAVEVLRRFADNGERWPFAGRAARPAPRLPLWLGMGRTGSTPKPPARPLP
jgi:hypothetical protein